MGGDESSIDMSCRSFGVLCGAVALVLVLVGLPALLVRLEVAADLCPCPDNQDIFSASVTSDTMLQALVTAQTQPFHFQATVVASYKGVLQVNTSFNVVFFSDPCPVAAALTLGSHYLLAGTYFPKESILEIGRCGNATLWDDVSSSDKLMRFVTTYYNWATASCTNGGPFLCGEDPCSIAPKCTVSGAVCVSNLCLPCPASAQATFWKGSQRVCM